MFKSGSKDALVEDIERSLKDNQNNIEEIEQKIKDIEKMVKGFEDVYKGMVGNHDYEQRQAYVKKMIEINNESRKQKEEMEKQKNVLKEKVKK